MKPGILIFLMFLSSFMINSCSDKYEEPDMKIIFLHHSTGKVIWNGNYTPSLFHKVVNRLNNKLANKLKDQAQLPNLLEEYNKLNNKNYTIAEMIFPKESPYGWNNYPFDYYNIWVKNAGEVVFKEEPTLEILTKEYDVIIFKHCFPVSNIKDNQDSTADIDSDIKTMANYKLQYQALRDKLHEFPKTKFVLFTGAVQIKSNMTEGEALRAKDFFTWVRNDWDLPNDNIFLWDLYELQTDGGLYFKNEFASSSNDSHPNKNFAEKAVKLLFNRLIDVIESSGKETQITGEKKSI